MMIRLVPLALAIFITGAAHAETCRFSGTTSHDGHLAARTEIAAADGLTTVDVTLEFKVSAWVSDYRYLGQEISTWRGSDLVSLAVNQRSFSGGDVVRQQWDVFTRRGDTLVASRVQAKRLAEFRQRHPGFVRHWATADFGQRWIADYAAAAPERRPDLDLPAGGVTTPFAFAFYWSRFLPLSGTSATVVLPGFKQNKLTRLALGPATAGDGWHRWATPLQHPGLDGSPPSLAAAWVSPDGYLLQLGMDVSTAWAAGRATLHADGCTGVQIRPG